MKDEQLKSSNRQAEFEVLTYAVIGKETTLVLEGKGSEIHEKLPQNVALEPVFFALSLLLVVYQRL